MNQGTISITGAYGAGNLGDEAILAGILFTLGREFSHYDLQVLSQDPARTTVLHGTPSVPAIPAGIRSSLRIGAAHEELARTKLVLIGGGGILYDAGFGRGSANPILAWWLRTELLRRWGIPYAFFAVGAGPIVERRSRPALRRMLEGAAFVSARDDASASLLRALSPRTAVVRIPDPAFALPPPGPQPIHRTIVAVRRWFSGDPDRENAFFEILLSALQPLKEAGEEIAFLPMTDNGEGDVTLANSLAEKIDAVALPVPASPAEAVRILATARKIVAMRLHALILGAVANRPIVPLAYSPKVAAIAEELGLNPLSLDTLTTDDLKAALERPKSPGSKAGELGMQFRLQTQELIESVLGST